ncbi:hypothetical protein GCM10028805_22780 [Spirosoma harenae]
MQAYQTEKPTVAELMDQIRDRAILLSAAIKQANERGIDVSVQKAPEGSENLIQLVFAV